MWRIGGGAHSSGEGGGVATVHVWSYRLSLTGLVQLFTIASSAFSCSLSNVCGGSYCCDDFHYLYLIFSARVHWLSVFGPEVLVSLHSSPPLRSGRWCTREGAPIKYNKYGKMELASEMREVCLYVCLSRPLNTRNIV